MSAFVVPRARSVAHDAFYGLSAFQDLRHGHPAAPSTV
jgi:hypothetical protein